MSEQLPKETQAQLEEIESRETPEQAQEREYLVQRFYELFGERLPAVVLGYPPPWSEEYRALLRAAVEAEDRSLFDAYLEEYPKGSTIA